MLQREYAGTTGPSEKYYYVIQVIRGSTYAHGPYKSKQGMENRLLKVQGGEVFPFSSFSSDPAEAIQEFNLESIR